MQSGLNKEQKWYGFSRQEYWSGVPLPSTMDLTEAEHIKKKWQEYTEELYKKDLHDQDNRDGVYHDQDITMVFIRLITHLQPDILECEVKWAFERGYVRSSNRQNHLSKGIDT